METETQRSMETQRTPADSACFDQHESGQELRQGGKLLESRSAFLACAASECPGAVQRDCERWSSEVEAQLPSVVFRVSLDGSARTDASLSIDGTPQPNALVVLDPGLHRYRVALPAASPQEGEFELQAGQPLQQVALELHALEPRGRVPTWSWVLGGVGLASSATFIGFGLSSRSLEHKLETSCAPLCSDHQIDRVRQRSLIANVALGVGLTSLLSAGALYILSRPKEPNESGRPTLRLRVVPVDGGALGNLQVRAF
jgi:anti-sigma factor RsiW